MTTGTVLIVDDTPENLRVLSAILRGRGYTARPAPSGRLAIQAARRAPPDVILLDINMPEMNGYEVCEALKADPSLASIPVIFISALNEEVDKVRAFEVGGVDYVTKPFQVEEVLARTHTHLALRRAQLSLETKNIELESALQDLAAAQAQLVHQEKMASLGVLTAGVAHELNNPINFICSCTIGLKKVLGRSRSQLDDALITAVDELAEGIETGADRAARIIEGLQLFSHPSTNAKSMTDLHASIDSALLMLSHQLKEVTVRKEYGEIPKVEVSPVSFQQVVVNLVKNAVDATNDQPGEGEIVIGTQHVRRGADDWVRILVQDNGPGVAPAARGRLFDPFFTTKEVGQGVGLGLAISHGIVREHGGRLDCENGQAPGATFRLEIPVRPAEHG